MSDTRGNNNRDGQATWKTVARIAGCLAIVLSSLAPAQLSAAEQAQLLDGLGTYTPGDEGLTVHVEDGYDAFIAQPHHHDVNRLGDGRWWPRGDRSAVACTPEGEHRFQVLYVRAHDDEDRSETMIPLLKDEIYDAGALIDYESQLADPTSRRRLKVACDSEGTLLVHEVTLKTALEKTTLSTIFLDLRKKARNSMRRSFSSPLEKYVIFFDECVVYLIDGQCVLGLAETRSDDRPSSENLNNAGPRFAFAFAYPDPHARANTPFWRVLLHELAHTMGAVQLSAPNSTGGFHCIDGLDLMCYRDGGPRAGEYSDTSCPYPIRFDCNRNDYFHPSPSEGSYLAEHWNIGASYNRFLAQD